MGDATYDGWTGVRTNSWWIGYAIASIVLFPFFLAAFVLYLLYRLVRRERGGEAGWTPWFIWIGLLVSAISIAYVTWVLALYPALVALWWWGHSYPEVSEDGAILVAWRRLGRRLSGRAEPA